MKYKNVIVPILTLIVGVLIGFVLWSKVPDGNIDASGHQDIEPSNHQHMSSSSQQDMNSSDNQIEEEIWTCSMHPQIRQNEFGICPICEMDLIPLDNSLGNDDPTVLRMSNEAVKLAQIETFIVGEGNSASSESEGNVRSSIKVDGTVELDERTVKSQTAHLSGRIEEMVVTFEGQYITKGQKIATLYSTELLAASQELITANQYNDRVEGLKEAAMQKLRNWKISEDQIQQIIDSGNPIETIEIFADHNGYVLDKKRSQGDYVRQGQALYSLGTTSRLWIVFNVFESDLSSVAKGNQVEFTTPSIPNKSFNAQVSYIDPLLSSKTRTAKVRAEISNVNQLKPGMLVNGAIDANPIRTPIDNEEPITIPNSAILWTGDRSVVYVQVPDSEVPTYEFREVKIVDRAGDYSTLKSGVENGEEVVTQGAFGRRCRRATEQ